jgi:hypothetical protein
MKKGVRVARARRDAWPRLRFEQDQGRWFLAGTLVALYPCRFCGRWCPFVDICRDCVYTALQTITLYKEQN